jgi:hypothetical protein
MSCGKLANAPLPATRDRCGQDYAPMRAYDVGAAIDS